MNGFARNLDLARVQFGHGEIAVFHCAGIGKILAVMRTARILARQGRSCDHLGDIAQRAQVQPVVPSEIEGKIRIIHTGLHQLRSHLCDAGKAALQPRLFAYHAHLVPHDVLQSFAQQVHRGGLARQRVHRSGNLGVQNCLVGIAQRHLRYLSAHDIPGDAAVNCRVRNAIPAQPVRPVRTAGVLARHVETLHSGARIHVDCHAAHEVMRSRHDLDLAARQVETAVGAALDHSFELPRDVFRPQMRH